MLGLLLTAVLLTGTGCSNTMDKNSYTQISMQEAAERMAQQEDYILLDVRTQEEFEQGHIPGAVCLPNEMIAADMPFLFGKDAEILLYCRSGRRSADAAKKLRDMGFTNVFDFGGIIDWPYETTTD